jgi:predicted 2-oxoglutarate/Fe(II)-dependent dioxygenase YbiX
LYIDSIYNTIFRYWNAHVDKANIASYDYSALLYLTTGGGVDFLGGDFAFIDPGVDRIVEPVAGRLLTFTSGLENLHQVRRVTHGARFVLAMWFTCSAERAG